MLRPCPGCRRHVAAEPACPFCGISLSALAPRPSIHGRFSRAAVFAGATLAGCWTGKTQPAEHHADRQTRDIPRDPSGVHTPGTIEGVVTDQTSTTPLVGMDVELRSHASGQSRFVTTDAHGHYAFTNVEPGDYDLIGMRSNNPRRPPQQATLTVGEGATVHRDVAVFVQPISNVPMPYGAPPARRRVV